MASSAQANAARERWRADLNDYEGEVLTRGGLNGTAKADEASLRRGWADLIEEFDAARNAFNAEMAAAHQRWADSKRGNDAKVQDYIENLDAITAFRAKADELRQVRGAWKDIDTFTNGVEGRDARVMSLLASIGQSPDKAPVIAARRACGVVNNFIEPTDAELLS